MHFILGMQYVTFIYLTVPEHPVYIFNHHFLKLNQTIANVLTLPV